MSKISRSLNRNTFQREAYLKRQSEQGQDPDSEYLRSMDMLHENHEKRFDNPERRKNDLEYDLLTTPWILEKARASQSYAQNIYAALCNQEWQRIDVLPILKDETWGCSWRYAGGIVADMLREGDYIDWYCSGIGPNGNGNGHGNDPTKTYVGEGCITEEIREDFKKLGWQPVNEDDSL